MKMALLKSVTNKDPRVDYLDARTTLYYGKYTYKATIHVKGAGLLWHVKTIDDIDINKISRYQRNRFKDADFSALKQYMQWKIDSTTNKKEFRVRSEGSKISVFSNDIDYLRTLDTALSTTIKYYQVEDAIARDTKYFVKEPKYKHRIYLKTKRVPPEFGKTLHEMCERYAGTANEICPSSATRRWLNACLNVTTQAWYTNYCSSGYSFDFNDESTVSLFSLMFPGMISRVLKLEKRPEQT